MERRIKVLVDGDMAELTKRLDLEDLSRQPNTEIQQGRIIDKFAVKTLKDNAATEAQFFVGVGFEAVALTAEAKQ